MMVKTNTGIDIDGLFVRNYFRNLVNRFFKILPMWENNEPSLGTYMRSFKNELLGCNELIVLIHGDPDFLSLISVLQYLIDTPNAAVIDVRREVFNAIAVCNKMEARYSV